MITYGSITVTDMEEGSQFWTTTTAPTTPDYTFTISNLTGDPNTDVKIGDIIFYDVYKYTVTEVGSTTVKADNRQSIQGQNGKMLYGTCPDTAIGTAAKVVVCTDVTELYAGLAITIKFVKGNSASAPTLNINELGAKNIYFGGANASSSNMFIFAANSEIQFVYNGTAFVPIGYPCTYYGTCTIAAGTAAKTSTIAQAVICKGTVVNLQMTNANTVANPTLNISSTGAKYIYANGAKLTADSPYNWIASSTVSFTFDGQYWRLGDTSSLNKIDVVNTLAQSAKDTADSKVTTYYSASTSAPTNPSTGDLWIKTDDNNSLWRYNGSSWISVDNSNIQTALTNAATAQATADGKIVTYAQDNQPNTGSLGDLWVDTNDNNKLYRHNGSTWVEVAPEYLIGGRNLILGTATPKTSAASASDSAYTGYYYFSDYGESLLTENTTDDITVSFDYAITGGAPSGTDVVRLYPQVNGAKGNANHIYPTENEVGHYVSTYKLISSQATSTFRVRFRIQYAVDGTTFVISNFKVEKGNIATTWTPAPEDIDSAIDEAQSTADAALSQSVWYATCDTVATEVNKVATISPTTTAFTLSEGVIVNVKFSTTNSGTVGSLTLNINNTGAKPIKYIYNGSYSNIPSAGYLKANQMYKFAYDGTYWIVELIYNTNTNTVGVYGGTGFIAGTNGIKQYSLIMEDGNGTWQSFTTTYGTGTSKPRNTVGFKPNKILYMSGKDNYAAGSACTTCFDGYSIDLQYSTNCGKTLVIGKPVYLVGTINNNDGLFYLEPTWWTQTEPVIEDGCIYIYLGTAYSTSNIYFTPENPIYIFKYEKFMKLTEATEIEAATALESANGKNTSYYQAEEPTLGTYKDGDTWFKMGLANIDGTKTGSIVSVDGDVKINDLVVDINAVQAGSGDPSPTNVRSISGWTGCNVVRTGKNLCNLGDYLIPEDSTTHLCWSGDLTGTFTVSFDENGITSCTYPAALFYAVTVDGVRTWIAYERNGTVVTGRITEIWVYGSNAYSRATGTVRFQIELSSTATAYDPYVGTTYPVTFPTEAGTVYGGTVDLVSGVLTVTYARRTLSSDAYFALSTNSVYIVAHGLIKTTDYNGKIYCDKLKTYQKNSGSMPIFSITGYNDPNVSYPNQNWIYFRVAETMTTQVMKDWLAEVGGIEIVYELATPQTYQLTPPQISLLANQVNNIWANTGDVTLTGSVATIDAAVEVYQYDEDDGWVLTPYGSGVFATIDAGKITTGTLSTILIKSNNNDYWNLSPIDVTDGNMVYKANTLQTNHLIAEDDIYIDGGSGSYFKIPTATNELSYIEIDDDGMTIQSTTDDNSESITTVYPSDMNAVIDVLDDSYNWDTATVNNSIYVSLRNSNLVQTISDELTCNEYDRDGNYVEQISSYQDWTLRSKGVTNAVQTPSGLKIYSDYKETFDDYIVPSGPYEGYKYVPVNNSYFSKTRATYGAGGLSLATMTSDYVRNFEIDLESGEITANGVISGYNVGTGHPWKFTLNGRRLDILSLKYQTYDSSAKTMSNAWGWINTVSVTIPANATGKTLIWRVSVKGVFSSVAQWSTRGLRISRNGSDGSQELFTAAIAQLSAHCHEDFWEQAPNEGSITFTGRALCSVANATIQYNRVVAEVVDYY